MTVARACSRTHNLTTDPASPYPGSMARIRVTYLLTGLLGLALLCGTLTSDTRVAPAETGPDSSYFAQVDATPADAVPGGFSHEGVPPEIASPLAIAGKGERSTAATLDTVATTRSPRLVAVASTAAQARPPAPSTPLYLSHCAFLC